MRTVIDYRVSTIGGEVNGSFPMAQTGPPQVGQRIDIEIENVSTPVRVDAVYSAQPFQGVEHIRIICSLQTVHPHTKT
jgi:hypothetical protein